MIGTTVAGRYYIEAQIGIGGMGIVYRARDERLRRAVAVKVIAPHLMQHPQARARFLREAQALAGLTHPNIVTVYDLAEDADAGLVLLIMELLSGQSLRQTMESETCPRSADCPPFSRVALPLCRALEAAHAHGVLHRDIKPENIFLCQDGTLKLMDFGLARLLGDVSKNHSSTVAGTLAYMAPEQLRGETLDARADLYALGVVFYEFLTEQLPFVADNPGAILLKHLTETAPRLHDARPDLPDALDALIARMLEKDPDARFASAHDVRSELEQTGYKDGTLAQAIDRLQSVYAEQPASARLAALPTRNVTANFASLPTLAARSDSAEQKTGSAKQNTAGMEEHPAGGEEHADTRRFSTEKADAGAAARSRRPILARSMPLYAGLASTAVVAALLVGKAWPRPRVPAAPSASQNAVLAPSVTLHQQGTAISRRDTPLSADVTAPATTAKATQDKAAHDTGGAANTGSDTGSLLGKASDGGRQDAAKTALVASASQPAQTGAAGKSALSPLSNSERAELDTLRREQQEELSLLRSLKQQIGSRSAPAAHASMPPLNPVASVPIGKAAGLASLPDASHTSAAHTPGDNTAASSVTRTRGTVAHTALPAEWPQPPTAGTPASLPSGAQTPSLQAPPQNRSETSAYEEARPNTPLRLRVLRHADPQDSRAIHISFRNSVDCYAYFYILDVEKHRAVRAFPGPERFLTLQTDTPHDIRLPLPGEIDNNHKAVLTLASSQEITNLPPAFNLPPAPLDMPAPGAGLPQMRQALHRYNDQIGMLLQQSHALVGGQPLHPHDVMVRVTGLRPPPAAH